MIRTFWEFVFQLSVADGFGGLAHLSQRFLKSPHASDYTAYRPKSQHNLDISMISFINLKRMLLICFPSNKNNEKKIQTTSVKKKIMKKTYDRVKGRNSW